MKVDLECFPCFVRQAVFALNRINMEERVKMEIVKGILDDIKSADLDKSPAHATTYIYRKLKELTKTDPYSEIKKTYNESALKLYPGFRDMVMAAPEPLWYAARLAIAGNIIDFGIYQSVDINATVKKALEKTIAVDDYELLKTHMGRADKVLYLLDNAGEIVFDMLLIEVLMSMGLRVTAVVKGGAVINDVTMEDAVAVGLDKHCMVVSNGTDAVGTDLDECGEAFLNIYQSHDTVISKGQGNFETLVGMNKAIFFLFQAKCDVVARHLGLYAGAMLLKQNIGGFNERAKTDV
ncbi:MAG: ARMT1-like domain-containing protein [Candidatus Magnetoovum sp. WYHC-5]|nr:ARMT1-like domain-containing protein [Candidatus Magnetoovum sp. WYHC-5]